MTTNSDNLGRAIEVRRTLLGLKRKDLAQRSGLSYPYISEIENGAKEPSAKALRQIADALEWSVAELAVARESLSVDEAEPSRHALDRGSVSAMSAFRDPELAAFFLPTPPSSSRGAVGRGSEPDDADLSMVGLTDDQVASVQAMIDRALTGFAKYELPQLVADEIQRRFSNPARGREHD